MNAAIGSYSLCVAVLVGVGAVLAALMGARFGTAGPLRASRWLMAGYQAMLTVAGGALVVALLGNDYSNQYVARYTERALPWGYKLAAFWAGQEGSILLWAWLLGGMAVVYAVTTRGRVGREAGATLAVLNVALVFMAGLMMFAADPFAPGRVTPADGHGLNPMLQDPGMIAHPPALFLGYAGFTIPYAMMMGALIAGRRDDGWVAGTRRWVVASWLFLTVGIVLGAQWAYVELGWGGYWAWDPVENASLLPWLTGTALLHSIMVQQQRGMMRLWNAGLFAATFALCIFGTYITRSGIIQSVHSFGASLVGTMFLWFLVAIVVVSVGVIAWRRRLMRPASEMPALVGREGAFMMVNVLLTGMTLLTLLGTMFPVISGVMTGDQKSVDQSFYNRAVAPMGMVLIGLMAVGPLLVYGPNPGGRLARGLAIPGAAAAVGVGAMLALGIRDKWGLAAGGITVLAAVAIGAEFVKATAAWSRTHGENVLVAAVRTLDGNHRRYGGQVVHVGVIMVMVGIVGSSLFGTKETYSMRPGESVGFGRQTMTYVGLAERTGANYTSVEATVQLTDGSGRARTFKPERRFYNKSEQPSSEVALQSSWREDVYVTLAGWESGGAVTSFQAVINPLVVWIWVGGVVMTVGGLVCLLPRLTRSPVAGTVGVAGAAGAGRVRGRLATPNVR